jgi:hypothetical protein
LSVCVHPLWLTPGESKCKNTHFDKFSSWISTVVEYSPHHQKVKGLILAATAGNRRYKMAKRAKTTKNLPRSLEKSIKQLVSIKQSGQQQCHSGRTLTSSSQGMRLPASSFRQRKMHKIIHFDN